MKFKMLALASLSAAALLASCATGLSQPTRTAEQQQELDKALAGRVAGAPVNCIPNYHTSGMQIVDDYTILFKDGRTIYLQRPRGGCPGIRSHSNILVTRLFGTTQLCSGDINHLVDPVSGIGGGACVFSQFVPYTKPAG
jgi:Family of unknown function (DUF6491)